MKILRRIVVVVVLLLVIVYAGGSWYFGSLIIEPSARGVDPATIPSASESTWEIAATDTVEIPAGANTIVADVYDNPAGNDCAVIVAHGLGGNRATGWTFGPIFYDLGCEVVAYDYAPLHNEVYLTYGFTEKDDLDAVIDWVSETFELPKDKVGVFGVSYGASTALQALPDNTDVAWVIAESPYATLDGIVRYQAVEQFGSWINIFAPSALWIAGMRGGFNVAEVSARDSVIGVETPVLLIHSQQDTFTPPENSQLIYDASNPETTRLFLTDWGAAHARSVEVDREAFTAIIYDFIAEFTPDFGTLPE